MMFLGLAVLAIAVADDMRPSMSPNGAELANAISTFTGARVDAADLRRITCTGFDEEPTEYACRWQQRSGHRWRRFSGYLAIDGENWLLIDKPAQHR